MAGTTNSLHAKVTSLLANWPPYGAERLAFDGDATVVQRHIVDVLASTHGLQTAKDIAFHLSDCRADMAFLVALHIYPERFTPEEMGMGIRDLLIHVPNHLAAAAQLAGWPVSDVFGVGVGANNDE